MVARGWRDVSYVVAVRRELACGEGNRTVLVAGYCEPATTFEGAP